MDLLLELHMDGGQLTEEDIREEVDTFMFEGHDTTAAGIIFALYSIGLYPDVQKKIHEELDSIFGPDRERPATMDDVRDMKYLECAIKESLRLFPPVSFMGRKLNEDIVHDDLVIPHGTTVIFNITVLHRNPEVFPDPEIFNPDRFAPDSVRGRHPFAFLPFSAGPRNCIGQKFAMLDEKVVISNVLRNFTLTSLDPRDKVVQTVEFTLKPSCPLRMRFQPR